MIPSPQMNAKYCRRSLFCLLSLGILNAADISGLWTGQVPGRFGKLEDVSFQFKLNGSALTGKLFGDEFDLAIEEGTLVADKLTFIVTTTNYYSREKVRFRYTGVVIGKEIEFTRERLNPVPTEKTAEKMSKDGGPKPFRVKRIG